MPRTEPVVYEPCQFDIDLKRLKPSIEVQFVSILPLDSGDLPSDCQAIAFNVRLSVSGASGGCYSSNLLVVRNQLMRSIDDPVNATQLVDTINLIDQVLDAGNYLVEQLATMTC